jgi:hypothetical protein
MVSVSGQMGDVEGIGKLTASGKLGSSSELAFGVSPWLWAAVFLSKFARPKMGSIVASIAKTAMQTAKRLSFDVSLELL